MQDRVFKATDLDGTPSLITGVNVISDAKNKPGRVMFNFANGGSGQSLLKEGTKFPSFISEVEERLNWSDGTKVLDLTDLLYNREEEENE